MEAAKTAIKNFTSKGGHHDTTVHERVAPAVQQETVTKNQEERVTTAIDKEVHQDHHHTSVQPIHDREVLPEQHHHRMGGVTERTFHHNDDADTKDRLTQEAAQFKNTTTRVEGENSTAVQPVAVGEHVHHHVHETIQPVINKQTIEPHVVHTTVPIHEVHHNSAQHHATTALPAVSMDEFKRQGGALGGRGERTDEFDGCPKHAHDSHGNRSSNGGILNGVTGSRNTVDDDKSLNESVGSGTNGHRVNGSAANGTAMSGVANNTSQPHKVSLLDKLNPMKDSDGDGKKGIMA